MVYGMLQQYRYTYYKYLPTFMNQIIFDVYENVRT